jgi:hypothetical protein
MPIIPEEKFEEGRRLAKFDFSVKRPFFDGLVVDFLHELSRALLKDPRARLFPDLVTFGYFCRASNLNSILQRHADGPVRFGWGTVIHIPPSNIPINFAFSLVFGMLSGNSNIVRMPTKTFPQNDILLEIFDGLVSAERFRQLSSSNAFVRTERGSAKLKQMIAMADGLVVWGGDATVTEFRSYPKKPRCVELYFPDRASSSIIDAGSYLGLSAEAKKKLAREFYNDTFLVDQNACSSPSIVFWKGEHMEIAKGKEDFWRFLEAELGSQGFELDTVARIDKFLDVMETARLNDGKLALSRYSKDIWSITDTLPKGARLRFGQFAEIAVQEIAEIASHLRPQEQTLTYFGLDPDDILGALGRSAILVDRIVPIGRALDINPYWDGKDVLSLMSRRVELVKR